LAYALRREEYQIIGVVTRGASRCLSTAVGEITDHREQVRVTIEKIDPKESSRVREWLVFGMASS